MGGIAQRDHAWPDTAGRASRSRQSRRDRSVWRYPGHGAVAWGGIKTYISILNEEEIERAITAFAGEPNGGLIVTPSVAESALRELIISLAARYRLPAVYAFRFWAAAGGLVSYGPDPIDQMRRAADYVDRILKGAKPSDLPVQTPTKYQLVINLKTAKALDLKIAPALIIRADEVIE